MYAHHNEINQICFIIINSVHKYVDSLKLLCLTKSLWRFMQIHKKIQEEKKR